MPSYSRCYSTLGLPDASLIEALDFAEAHQLDTIELRALGGRIDLPAYLTERHGSPAALASRLGDRTRRIAALDTSLRLLNHTPEDREAFLAFVPWAEALGVRWLRLFDGGQDISSGLQTARETFRWWRELKERHGWRVDLMIETHDALLDSACILALVAVCPGLGILWDTHHTWKMGGEPPAVTWRRIQRHVVHIHVKESVSIPAGNHPFSFVLPGTGEFPMATLQPQLAAEFTGAVSLEWERHWHPDLPPLAEALQSASALGWW